VLDNAPKGVPMSGNENALPLLDHRDDGVIPIGKSSFDGQFQRLKHGKFFFARLGGVTRIVHDDFVEITRLVQWWWGDVEASAPDLDLNSVTISISN